MYPAILISAFTLIISYFSIKSIDKLCRVITQNNWITYVEQISRASILAFILTVLLPECINHYSVANAIIGISLILGLLQSLDLFYKKICHLNDLQNSPWFLYILLVPHCCIEGVAISPYLISPWNNISIISFFLIHKIVEICMIAISTKTHNMDIKTQNRIEKAFILTTPICMLLGGSITALTTQVETFHAIAVLINTAVFAHLSLFCQFCSCEHDKNKENGSLSWTFIITLSLTSFMLTTTQANPSPCQHAHHHHHDSTKA